jgi:hypothetical protein
MKQISAVVAIVVIGSVILLAPACRSDTPSTPEYRAVIQSMSGLRQLQSQFDLLTVDLAPATLDHPVFVRYARVSAALEFLDRKKASLDFAKMPVEDAVMMMFMLISDDAREDMHDMLTEMDTVREKKAALRDATSKMQEGLSGLEGTLRSEWDALRFEVNGAATSVVTVVHELRPVGSPTTTPLPPAGIGLEVAAAGDVAAELDCPSGQYGATLTIRDLRADTLVTTQQGNADLLLASAHFDARTVVRVDASVSGLMPFQMLACKLRVSYPKIQRGRHPLSPEVRAAVAGAIANRDLAAQELLKVASSQNSQNVQYGLAALVSSRSAYVGAAGSFADLDTAANEQAREIDTLSEGGEEQQLKMQMIMDRMAKADTAAASAMKKFSDVTGQIISNLK